MRFRAWHIWLLAILAGTGVIQAQEETDRRARWSGDVRMRWQGDHESGRHAINALQWAFRLNITKPVNDQASFGMQFMTGDPLALPVAGWVNASGFLDRKPIHIQWMYARYAPRPGMTFWGGKFTMPFFRASQLVFDNDIPLEGLGQQFRFPNADDTAALGFNLAQILINQPLSRTQDVTRSYFLGAQVTAEFKRPSASGTFAVGLYGIGNADSIFVAENGPVRRVRTANRNRPNAAGDGYLSEFRFINVGARLTRPVAARPLTLSLDYAFNPAASNERQGIVGILTYGNHRRLGGTRVTLQGFMVQADAVAAVFSSIDYIQTNQNGGGISVDYQPIPNVELMWALYARKWRNPTLLVTPSTRNELRYRGRFQIMMRF